MNIQKLPLAERIECCRDGCVAYPEYIPSIILSLGETPVMEYLAGISPEQRQRFSELTGIGENGCTYQQAALRISELRESEPELAAEATRILAEPMIRCDEFVKEQEECSND